MLSRTLFLSLSLGSLTFAAFTACSSSPSGAGPGNDAGIDSGGSSSGSSGGSSCGSALFETLPAILTVESAAGGPIACDATLTVVAPDPEAGAGLAFNSCTSDPYDCPPLPADGGKSCVYSLTTVGSGTVGTYTVEIAQAGFTSQVVPGVTIGSQTCEAIEPASTTTVLLVPAPVDASADAPADAEGEDAHVDGD